MKFILQRYVASAIHALLAMFGAWVTAQTGYEYSIDPSMMTLAQFMTGLLLVGLVLMLKWLDGTRYGPFIRSVVGDRTASIAHGIIRFVLAVLVGVYGAWLTEHLPPGELGEHKVEVIGVVITGLIVNMFYKKVKP